MMTTLVAGSYERFWFAYEVEPSQNENQELSRAFSFPAHQGPVKCIAGASPFVASGGADDTVHIYNAEAKKDLGFLMNPGDGAVTAVEFYTPAGTSQPTHLLSGAADGSISVWGAGGSWECLKVLKGHKKEVTSLSVHPSGLLALSTSRDDMLRMWNMAKGRSQYKTKITPGTESVSFSPNGDIYALLSGLKVTAHNVSEEGDIAATFQLGKRGLCMTFMSDQVIVVGGEDGSLSTLDLRTDGVQITLKAHGTRVRGVAALSPGDASDSEPAHQVASAATDGFIRLWDLRNTGSANSSHAQQLCETSTSARLTCLTVLQPGRKAPASLAVPQQKASAADDGGKAPAEQKHPRKRRKEEADQEKSSAAARDVGEEPKGVPEKAKGKKVSKAEAIGKEGVVVQRKAERVVEFPDEAPKRKKTNTTKGKKRK